MPSHLRAFLFIFGKKASARAVFSVLCAQRDRLARAANRRTFIPYNGGLRQYAQKAAVFCF